MSTPPTPREFCAQCLSEVGPFEKRPYGRNGGLVSVCQTCENEHPRQGRYSFSETIKDIPRCHGHKTMRRR